MKSLAHLFGALLTCTVAGSFAEAGTESGPMQVRGTFEVKLDVHEPDNPAAEAAGLMRMSLDKTFRGALDATARGEMMAHGDGTDSGAYVAIEKVEGTLDGRRGSFALVHMATMRGTTPEYWSIRVIPDSGTDELEGIEGEMTITIDEDGHHYEFSYQLPTAGADADGSREIAAAAAAINEFDTACSRVEPIWPVKLCGEIVLVHPQTRLAVANRPAPDGSFQPHDGVFVGTWPADKGVANTGFEWDGQMWAMVMLPLPEEQFSRLRLLAHESFHRIQPALGYIVADPMATHLDEETGRVWLRLEIRALAHALTKAGEASRDAAADALLFRAVRHDAYPDAVEIERQLEAHEGLAEYTGVRFALDATNTDASEAAEKVKAFERRSTYIRSLGYGTGPALGLLLDRFAPGWRDELQPEPDLAALLAAALQDPASPQQPEARLQLAGQRAAAYDDEVVRAEESERAERLSAERARYRSHLVDGPVLVIDAPELRLMFNPNTVLSLGDMGNVYPGAILMGPWGQLTLKDGGALAPDRRDRARVAAPEKPQPDADGIVHGPGWTLQLKPGWHLAPGPRDGDFRLVAETHH